MLYLWMLWYYSSSLFDDQMPVMDGEEATRIIRSKGNSKVPIFAMTATVNLSRYEALGFNGMIAKVKEH